MYRNKKYYIRKAHRYLGVVIGIQFIFWTVSGLYFSWTDLDEIHGDHFLQPQKQQVFNDLLGINQIDSSLSIYSLSLKVIMDEPYYFVNDSLLFHARTGQVKHGIHEDEARKIARSVIKETYTIATVELITETGPHHEYRGRKLPAYAVHFEGSDSITVYVNQEDGSFQRARHESWRWFDFLWMTHTMDYQGRDDFNNVLLRAFSLFGVFTVISGFVLFFSTLRINRSGIVSQSKS